MDSRRILITGSNGFVGRHLVAYLLRTYAEKVQIVAAMRPEDVAEPASVPTAAGWTGDENGRISIAAMELCDPESVDQVVMRTGPDQIVHLAARASGADSDRESVLAVNVDGARNLLEAAARLSPFPRVLVISTGYVYGDTDPQRPAREEDPIGPLWRYGPYTDSKIEMENVARNYRGFALVARAFAHTGPGQLPAFAVPSFARQLARIEQGVEPPVLRVGNLDALRDLLDVRDVVRAYDRILETGSAGDVYNVALGRPVAMRQVLDRLRVLCRVPTRIETDPARMRPADIACSTGDPSRLHNLTGWNPDYTLDQTLQDTLDYWRTL